ncbi:MAG: hypothetical protein JNK82_10410 [Myxococcaceae bacterium]|nr:hypothetical protein [Myxococcaceae bacterium]
MRRALVAAAVVTVFLGGASYLPRAQFVAGGALVSAGSRLQDHLGAFDLVHEDDITAEQVWQELEAQNALASSVRERLGRHEHHPVVAMLVCMDARLDTNELSGDTRRNTYVIRTAGSVMSPEEEDMLELAVEHGVKVLVVSRHTDCAAEKVARDPAERAKYPALSAAIDEREVRLAEFLARPAIASRVASGELIVKRLLIETGTEHFTELAEGGPGAAAPNVERKAGPP